MTDFNNCYDQRSKDDVGPIINKIHEIGKPLQLTPNQVQQVKAQLGIKFNPTSNLSQNKSFLVKKVALAISQCEDPGDWGDEIVNWTPEARAAIRQVATWLSEAPLDVYQDDRSIMVNALLDEANR
jgi:hypothetical protein